jgi:hypothetical protein
MKSDLLTPDQQRFVRAYSEHVKKGDAALFAGAGLSCSAGFVDWRDLLRDAAAVIGLDIGREQDLVSVAQYYVNSHTRSALNAAIFANFLQRVETTRNHYLLARMPIQTIWTTNYDHLIEKAFKEAGKTVSVKLDKEDFALRSVGDLTLYKMHGDAKRPDRAVLTQQDYENYEGAHPLFLDNLKIDLVSKTFLFIGFSLTDPNFEYVLSRIRILLGNDSRQHFALFKDPEGCDPYEMHRLALWKDNLRHYNIEIVPISEYSDVEHLLSALLNFTNRENVFVSGSSMEFGGDLEGPPPVGDKSGYALGRLLGKLLIEKGYNLVSGFGSGIGEQCVLGSLRALYTINDDARKRVIVRPFPTALRQGEDQRRRNTRTREDLISRAGAVVFISGNQVDSEKGIIPSSGVLEEFDIASKLQRFIIPVAATGHAAEVIWKTVESDRERFYPGMDVSEHLTNLADRNRSIEDLADTVLQMLQLAE